jgi:anti-sigma B factor antagonist
MASPRMRRAAAKHFAVQDIVNRSRHRLVLSGELDLASARDLETVILKICGNGDGLVLDLSRLTFMDSSGLRLILLAHGLCREGRCEFAVVPGQQNIQHLLEISGTLWQIPLVSPAWAASSGPVADSRERLLPVS